MNKTNRRNFLKGSLLGAASLSLAPRSWAQVDGSAETIRVAVVGFNGRGGNHISGFQSLRKDGEKVKVVALCDVDQKVLQKGIESFSKNNEAVDGYTDIRRVLDNKDIDAISIATPNHWHSLATIWAVQAGKDVYCEKPVSHNVFEGRQMVVAARKYNKIVQTGTQSRSSTAIREAIEWVRAGNLGKITLARGLCYKPRQSIGRTEGPLPVPDHIDYDLWCGPAPLDPLRRSKLHYDWHWIWAYGNGDLGNQGIHEMDRARWFLGEMELAPRVFSAGGRLGYQDDGETANTQFVFHDYKVPLIFEVRGLFEKTGAKNMDFFKHPVTGAWKYKDARSGEMREQKSGVSVVIHCEGGYIINPSYSSVMAFDKEGNHLKSWGGGEDHYANFLKACRSRKHTDLNADILEGHLSSALCHTGNISYRLGWKKAPGEIREKLQGNSVALETFGRMEEHLKANDVDLQKDKLAMGEFLTMDPKTERFIGNREADALLTRHYRRPYVVPEKV